MHPGGSFDEHYLAEDRLVVLSLYRPGGSPEEIQDEQYLRLLSIVHTARGDWARGGPSGRGLSYKPF